MPVLIALLLASDAAIVVTAPGSDSTSAIAIDTTALARTGRADLLAALETQNSAVSLAAATGNRWQPNLVFHGFSASPLQGNPQGLAVYVDGIRFNQPFGDSVQFDLLPDLAIESVAVEPANPVFGLNALGGALVLTTRTGKSSPGHIATLTGGSAGNYGMAARSGWSDGATNALLLIDGVRESGWRDRSPSRLLRGFADFGRDGDRAGIHFKLLGATTRLTGNGAVPVELLAARRRAVFTSPDQTRNRFARLSLHPWAQLGDHQRIEASLAVERLDQRTANGDVAEVESCEDPADAGLLCDENGERVLTGAGGASIADTRDGEGYGFLNRSRTKTNAASGLLQLVDTRALGAHTNRFVIGASLDRSGTDFTAQTELGALDLARTVSAIGPVIDQAETGPIRPVDVRTHTRHFALFAQEQLPLSAKLSAILGVRWNHARITLADRIGSALNGRHRFSRINPGLAVHWRPSAMLEVRGGYSQANRTPTPAELACADPEAPCSLTNFFVGDPPLQQVVTRSWHGELRGRAGASRWHVSGWRSTNRNDLQLVASQTLGRAYFQNIGRTRRQGIDAGFDWQHDGWSASLGYSFTDARFLTALTLSSPLNPQADANGLIHVRRGNHLAGVPRHRATATLEWTRRDWRLGADVSVIAGQWAYGDEANLTRPTRSYALAGAHAAIDITAKINLFASVTNVFDTKTASFATFSPTGEVDISEVPGASDPRALGPGAPRTWQLGVTLRL